MVERELVATIRELASRGVGSEAIARTVGRAQYVASICGGRPGRADADAQEGSRNRVKILWLDVGPDTRPKPVW